MKEFAGKVAVVTGAASGIGRALAEHCAQERMKVVLADVEEPPLFQTERALRESGASVLAVPTDVSKLADVQALGERTLAAFGAVHLLCNNAGVGAGASAWEATINDWKWVIGANLWGVIYGVHVFVPIMLGQHAEGHVVNTASVAGLVSYHPAAPYQVTKHAVVALTENLHQSLALQGSRVKASVLCPGWVKTRILESARNRPPELQDPPTPLDEARRAAIEQVIGQMRAALAAGITPEVVAEEVFRGIREERLYILTQREYDPAIRERMESILA